MGFPGWKGDWYALFDYGWGGWEGDEAASLGDALRILARKIDEGCTSCEIIDRMPGGSQFQYGLREYGPAMPRKINVFSYEDGECYHAWALREEEAASLVG